MQFNWAAGPLFAAQYGVHIRDGHKKPEAEHHEGLGVGREPAPLALP
jgi:hypothetical protein